MTVGIWIDHRQATIVELHGEKDLVRVIESDVEKHVRLAGGSRSATPWGPQDVAKEQTRDRKFEHHLNRYYDQVIEALREAEAIFLCGPGEAKTELSKRMEKSGLNERVIAVETVDKLTERQLAARVRAAFGEARAGARPSPG
jgi:hypothetical protein